MDVTNCAACNFITGPCSHGHACVMAPYFPATEPEKFDRVHKTFGFENVYKILSNLEDPWKREAAARALSYLAEVRMNDPIHGYVGQESVLVEVLNNLKREIHSAKNELAITMGPDKAKQFFSRPISDDFQSLFALINEMSEDQKNQRRGDGGASTSSGPSMAAGSTSDTQHAHPLPPDQNKP